MRIQAITFVLRRLAALACAIAVFSAAGAVHAVERRPAATVTLRAGPAGVPTFVRAETATALRARPATFVVTYNGFSTAARAAFQRAVNIWATQISATVPINVTATYQPLGGGILGSASPASVWSNFRGAPRPDTWYVDALANERHGGQLGPEADILVRFNSSLPNWHFGAGQAPAGKYDFTSAVLHEIAHGLGFLGAGEVRANRGTVRLVGFPGIFDRYTENRTNRRLLSFPDSSTALSAQLRGGSLFFDSIPVRTANSNLRARIYAPPLYEPGSSYSHLDEASYPRGDRNALMTPRLGMGESVHSPGPLTLAILQTLGW